MALFENFPYTNYHDINLDWMIKQIIEQNVKLDEFIAGGTIKYADPIQWDITKQYEKNTVTLDPNTNIAYISTQPVPAGTAITNTAYWSPIFDLTSTINNITQLITNEETARENADINLQNQINAIDTTPKEARGYIGMCHLNTEGSTGILYTEDFTNIHVVKRIDYISDAASLYHHGEWYYATYGRKYMKSQDLVTWYQGANQADNPYGYSRIWGGHITEMLDGTFIWIGTWQTRPDSDNFSNGAGYTSYYFETRYCPITFDDDGEIVFTATTPFPLAPSSSVIDCWLLADKTENTYYCALKDEITTKISWYKGASINALTLIHTNPAYGVEAPCLIQTETGDIVTTADFYITKMNPALGMYFAVDQLPLYSWLKRDGSVRLPIFSTSASPGNLRHCTWIPCDAETYDIISQMGMHFSATSIGEKPFKDYVLYIYNRSNPDPTYVVPNFDRLTYIEVYENVASFTLSIPANCFTGGNDIVVWCSNNCPTCDVTFRSTTYTITPTQPLILKYTRNYYFAYMPDLTKVA